MKVVYIFVILNTISLNVFSAGTASHAPITAIEPAKTGTYISNCPYSNVNGVIQIEKCISSPVCGAGKWFFIPNNNTYHDTFLSIALTSSVAKVSVFIKGSNVCESSSSYEGVEYIQFIN